MLSQFEFISLPHVVHFGIRWAKYILTMSAYNTANANKIDKTWLLAIHYAKKSEEIIEIMAIIKVNFIWFNPTNVENKRKNVQTSHKTMLE